MKSTSPVGPKSRCLQALLLTNSYSASSALHQRGFKGSKSKDLRLGMSAWRLLSLSIPVIRYFSKVKRAYLDFGLG